MKEAVPRIAMRLAPWVFSLVFSPGWWYFYAEELDVQCAVPGVRVRARTPTYHPSEAARNMKWHDAAKNTRVPASSQQLGAMISIAWPPFAFYALTPAKSRPTQNG
jgi:hypothetical protein